MRMRVIAALVGALALMPAAARAADLDYDRGAEAPYHDPREYADPRPAPHYEEHRYALPPRDYAPSGKDHGYLAPMQPPPRYSQAPRYERDCLPRREIHARLRAEGWRDFSDIDIRGQTAYVKAQHRSGELYDLEVDRCTGDIVNARRLGYAERPYAYREPQRYRGY